MDTTLDGITGDWGPALWDEGAYTANNGPQVQSDRILDQATVSEGSDQWGGFLRQLVGGVTQYVVAKDAAQNGLRPTVAPNGQQIYTAAPRSSSALLIGLVIVAGVLLAKKV